MCIRDRFNNYKISKSRLMNKFLQKNYLLISILSTVILFLSFNFIIQKINFNLGIDFTSTKTFTLSSGTKRVIDEIEELFNFIYNSFCAT